MVLRSLLTLSRPALLALPPEKAHEISLKTLEAGLFPPGRIKAGKDLHQEFWGLNFRNPVGMAAGFDKNARVPHALLKGGFGFTEVGTLTPKPQSGNAAPRVFRLIQEKALINRLGFNNEGHAAALTRLEKLHAGNFGRKGPIGVNIGANKLSKDKITDYLSGLEAFYHVADYFTVNISSPNTPGLRDLQGPEHLNDLLGKLANSRQRLADEHQISKPVLVKFAPDLEDQEVGPIAEIIMKHNIDGMIVSNTTLSRNNVKHASLAKESGGLSGKPLFERSTRLLARFYLEVGKDLPLIGVGGIHSGQSALEKIKAGASLLQLYTGLIYAGPSLIDDIILELSREVERSARQNINEITGIEAKEWANRKDR